MTEPTPIAVIPGGNQVIAPIIAGVVMTGQSTLVDKPDRTRRYHAPPDAARTIAALLTLRDPQPTDGPQSHDLDPGRPRLT